ncbi:endonuclease/exonuclease/phosphatase family protein [Streptomyces turgidiscabies]|uniref:Tat pathway signal sequence domain protein n=1 Tax=Streptomyces turgidiscabies (strain Car8) TaxID=698760 RepID=L7EXY3_STRT8|nr:MULTISPECIES: endonuclease/exonuclease/phosphatase family protein [Streptomyces]ELP63546.1 Tat pathway signal sequence domain protein [Streptomyces turgidiscabies Car8]MDX3496286.1 endonuclease/exonuclease/phosphatase family protein [Streptomyces turgidiscabies]GAQ74957.1 endonuclease/exonuclease/phosphatase family protein [Streptomyces turgidiscabies]
MPREVGVTRRHGLKSVAAAAIAMPLLTTAGSSIPAVAGEHAGALNVMTFNVRFATVVDKTPRWSVRRPVMRELLRRERPHVIGTQEGLYQQVRMIEKDLGGHYDWIGTGRGGGSKDEFMAVFYDTRRLEPLEFDHFWLSDTPYTIASNTWNADWLRMVTWVKFADLADGGREFYVLNTHLDNVSQYARERSAGLIGETIAKWDPSMPVIVTGDFNSPAHENRVYDLMLANGLVDTWDAAASRSPEYGTFNAYRAPKPGGRRIDWILTSPGVTTHRAAINTFSVDGMYASDHLPVQASLTLG